MITKNCLKDKMASVQSVVVHEENTGCRSIIVMSVRKLEDFFVTFAIEAYDGINILANFLPISLTAVVVTERTNYAI